jgi:hypothetical protein
LLLWCSLLIRRPWHAVDRTASFTLQRKIVILVSHWLYLTRLELGRKWQEVTKWREEKCVAKMAGTPSDSLLLTHHILSTIALLTMDDGGWRPMALVPI